MFATSAKQDIGIPSGEMILYIPRSHQSRDEYKEECEILILFTLTLPSLRNHWSPFKSLAYTFFLGQYKKETDVCLDLAHLRDTRLLFVLVFDKMGQSLSPILPLSLAQAYIVQFPRYKWWMINQA